MPCRDSQNWTFPDLLGAFLDLAIAYLLLCGSLLVHLVSKFLGFFGSSLPSSQNGCFGQANHWKCIQGHLLDCASEKIHALNRSVKNKIPFALIMSDDSNQYLESKSRNEIGNDINHVGCGNQVSCKFLPIHQDASENVAREEQNAMNNGKRFATRRSRNVLRNRKKAHVDPRKHVSTSVFDSLQTDRETVTPWPRPTNGVARRGAVDSEGSKNSTDEISLQQNLSQGSEFDGPGKNLEHRETLTSPDVKELKCDASAGESSARNVENTIRVLEEALEEEHAACATMSLELERERSASASAADEAMAMILRLQDEKASIEMEARQFQRMIEEKSAFDAEEMNILKDILVRRERETHFLEKEVEAYREMLVDTDELESLARERPDQKLLIGSGSFIESEKIEKLGKKEDPIEDHGFQEKTITLVEEEIKEHDDDTKKSREDVYKSDSEIYSHVRDVHMVNNEVDTGKMQDAARKNVEESDRSVFCRRETWGGTVSDMACRLPPLCRPRGTTLNSSGSQRKSMSAVDYERLKIENEVEWLRERLRAVQEGREKLTRRASLPQLSSEA